MSELSDLYQEVILDHNRRPRNHGSLEEPSHHADGHNPLCGDRIAVDVKVEAGTIVDVKFKGAGCAISTASASLMTEAIRGKTTSEVERLFRSFRDLVTGQTVHCFDDDELGKLAVFHGVSEYPIRVKCATLAWHTLQAALKQEASEVSTE